jgi:cell division protein FtsW (lipid II flippase)
VGLLLGLGLIGFGVLTRVRRRALFGVATFVLSLVLMIVVPLVGLTPQFSGPALWITIAAVGLVAIFVAAFLEQGRRAVTQAVARLRELTKDSE